MALNRYQLPIFGGMYSDLDATSSWYLKQLSENMQHSRKGKKTSLKSANIEFFGSVISLGGPAVSSPSLS